MKRKASEETTAPPELQNAYITDKEKGRIKINIARAKEEEFSFYAKDMIVEDEYYLCRIFFYNLFRTYGIIATLVVIFIGVLYLFTNVAIYVENLPFLTTALLNWIFYPDENI